MYVVRILLHQIDVWLKLVHFGHLWPSAAIAQ